MVEDDVEINDYGYNGEPTSGLLSRGIHLLDILKDSVVVVVVGNELWHS